MQKLVDGIHKFRSESFSQDQKLFETLADGQNPLALFITCPDSRIDPIRLTQTNRANFSFNEPPGTSFHPTEAFSPGRPVRSSTR